MAVGRCAPWTALVGHFAGHVQARNGTRRPMAFWLQDFGTGCVTSTAVQGARESNGIAVQVFRNIGGLYAQGTGTSGTSVQLTFAHRSLWVFVGTSEVGVTAVWETGVVSWAAHPVTRFRKRVAG